MNSNEMWEVWPYLASWSMGCLMTMSENSKNHLWLFDCLNSTPGTTLFCKSRWLIGVLHRAPVFWRTLKVFLVICKFVTVCYLLLPCCFTGLDYQQRPIESARILGGLQLALDQENQKVAGRSCWWEWSTSDKNTAVVVVVTFLEATTIFFWNFLKVIFWQKVLKLIGWYMLGCLFVVDSCWSHFEYSSLVQRCVAAYASLSTQSAHAFESS